MKSQSFHMNLSPSFLKTLEDGLEKGLWTLENLDKPSPGWISNTRVDLRFFPDGYTGKQHRNLLREAQPSERVEVISPRDLPF